MSKLNLLRETLQVLSASGKTPKDIEWIGSLGFGWFDWAAFEAIADVEYDSGFGGNEVVGELMIVGSDWWMTRGEYDGSEWWDFHTKPTKPTEQKRPSNLLNIGYGDKIT